MGGSEPEDEAQAPGELTAARLIEEPGESEVSGVPDKPPKSLSRALLNFELSRVLALLMGAPWLIALGMMLAGLVPFKTMFWLGLIIMLPLVPVGLFAFGASALLFEFAYLWLPGRHQRDLRWLSSWRAEHHAKELQSASETPEVLDVEESSLGALVPALAGRNSPFCFALSPIRNLNGGVPYGCEIETLAGPGEAPAATLWVGPYIHGYRVQLQIKLPPRLMAQMAPCVGIAETMQDKWAPDLLPSAEKVHVPVRVFVDAVVRDMFALEDMPAMTHEALWLSLYQMTWWTWAQSEVYWRMDDNTMVIDRRARPHRLDPTLQELRELAARVWPVLIYALQPLHLQITASLFDNLYRGRKPKRSLFVQQSPKLTGEAWRLRWWAALAHHFGDQEETQEQFTHFFLYASKQEHRALFQGVSARIREETLVPWLCAFVARGRIHTVPGFLGPFTDSGANSLPLSLTPDCFGVWLSVLREFLPEAQFVALCTYVIVEDPWQVGGAEGYIVQASHKAAMRAWLSCDVPGREEQLCAWLQDLELPRKLALLQALVANGKPLEGLRAPLLPLLFAEQPQLTSEERELCLAAIALAALLGGEAIIATLQQGLSTWDDASEAAVIVQATHTLGTLMAMSGSLQGALSTVGSEGEEGQVSLAEDEKDGQLSLVQSHREWETQATKSKGRAVSGAGSAQEEELP